MPPVALPSSGPGNSHLYTFIDHVSTIVSIPLALAGFAVTFWQLFKTRKAAEAARTAAIAATKRVGQLNLAKLLPQLLLIYEDIDRSVRQKSIDVLVVRLSQWIWCAGEVRGLLDREDIDHQKVMRSIQSSISASSDVRLRLHEIEIDDLGTETDKVRKSVSKVTAELGTLASRQLDSDSIGTTK